MTLIYAILAFVIGPAVADYARTYSPDHFVVNDRTRLPNAVWNASYPTPIEQLNDESFSMDSSATAVISCVGCTQYIFEFTPQFVGEGEFNVEFRTTDILYRKRAKAGIVLRFVNNTMEVWEGQRMLHRADGVEIGEGNRERIVIENFAHDYSITFGCRSLYRGTTQLHAADAIVMQSSPTRKAMIYNIVRNSAFDDLNWGH